MLLNVISILVISFLSSKTIVVTDSLRAMADALLLELIWIYQLATLVPTNSAAVASEARVR